MNGDVHFFFPFTQTIFLLNVLNRPDCWYFCKRHWDKENIVYWENLFISKLCRYLSADKFLTLRSLYNFFYLAVLFNIFP